VAADYYAVLGVSRSASTDEIKRAYRRKARDLHPDTNPDPEATTQFREVARAYECLSDPERRQRYDHFGTDDRVAADPFGGGGLGDIFDAFFGGSGSPFGARSSGPARPPGGADLETTVEIELEQAVFGAEVELDVRTAVPCETCEATGAAPGTHPETCGECDGRGQVQRVRQSLLGQMVTAGPCPRCHGLGQVIPKPCPDCRGEGRKVEQRNYMVDVPAGVGEGSTLRLSGRGAVGPRGGPAGDLYVSVGVRPDPRFDRRGDDLVHRLKLAPTQLALGTTHTLETFDGPEEVQIPRGTQPGEVFRFRSRGVPHVGGRGRGDLLVEVDAAIPTDLGEEEEELLRRLAEVRDEPVAEPPAGLRGRLRGAFKS